MAARSHTCEPDADQHIREQKNTEGPEARNRRPRGQSPNRPNLINGSGAVGRRQGSKISGDVVGGGASRGAVVGHRGAETRRATSAIEQGRVWDIGPASQGVAARWTTVGQFRIRVEEPRVPIDEHLIQKRAGGKSGSGPIGKEEVRILVTACKERTAASLHELHIVDRPSDLFRQWPYR